MAKATRHVGEINRYKQKLIALIEDPDPKVDPLWVVECERPDGSGKPCGYRYGSNGIDFFQRKCPVCHDGQPGPSIAGTPYA